MLINFSILQLGQLERGLLRFTVRDAVQRKKIKSLFLQLMQDNLKEAFANIDKVSPFTVRSSELAKRIILKVLQLGAQGNKS